MIRQIITDEKFVNIQKAQSGLTRLLVDAGKTETFYRVLKNDQPLGILMPENMWQSLTEDLEALSSSVYRQKISKARAQKKVIRSSKVKKQLGL